MSEQQRAPEHGPMTGTPAWVKAFAAIAVILVVVFIILHLTGNAPIGHGG